MAVWHQGSVQYRETDFQHQANRRADSCDFYEAQLRQLPRFERRNGRAAHAGCRRELRKGETPRTTLASNQSSRAEQLTRIHSGTRMDYNPVGKIAAIIVHCERARLG